MLEIIGIILLCNINKKNAVARGKGTGGAIGLTIGLWIGAELLGAVIGTAADMGMGSYILALVFAIAGGAASYFIIKRPSGRPNMQNSAAQYVPPQSYQPQSPYNAGGYPQTAYAPQGNFCINCGNRLDAGMKFCPLCGQVVNTTARQSPAQAMPVVSTSGLSPEPCTAPPAEVAAPPVPAPCVHVYKHLICSKCGEKASKPQLTSEGIRKENKYTYEDYSANTAEEARYFLEQTPVTEPLYYVMVHTPQGNWGKDKDSVFLSQLCNYQRDLSLRQCDAKTSLVPERLQDLQMAANRVTDNYLLSVTCGECGYSWVDGVGYRTKTVVRCPECGRYNLADTEHIRFNNL